MVYLIPLMGIGQHGSANRVTYPRLSQLQDAVRVSIDEEFLSLTKRSTMSRLRGTKEESIYIVLRTIKLILDDDNWWYLACICNKKVYLADSMYFCDKCNRHVINVTPRYRIKVDETDSATFVIFDRDAATFLSWLTRLSYLGWKLVTL